MLVNDINKCVLSHPAFGEESLTICRDDFMEDKKFKNYVRNIERLVRTSPEYKSWLQFVYGVLGTNLCCYQTGELPISCTIHMHHHPITLYDWVVICIENTTRFDTFSIAEEVMALHYNNSIGFIPLCATSHEKYHNDMLVIPIELVEGNWREFIQVHGTGIPEYILNNVTTFSSVSLANCNDTWAVKEKHYLDVSVVTSENIQHVDRSNLKKAWGDTDENLLV